MTHSSAGRSRDTGDEGNDRLGDLASLVELLEELGGVFLHGATDLADEDDTLGAGVLEKDLKGVDVGGSEARDKESIENKVSIKTRTRCRTARGRSPGERVSSDSNDEGLAESDAGGLVDSLVVEGSRAGDDT